MEQVKQGYLDFISGLHHFMLVAAGGFIIASLIWYIIHRIKYNAIKSNKGKFDYLKLNQIKNLQITVIIFCISIFCYGNTVADETVTLSLVYIFVRGFIALCIAVLIGYIFYLILQFYYPTKLEKRLRALRYAPRISKTGNEMRLLSEEEEDVHLDEGKQAEENAFSVDYDVWVDEKTGEVQIEKYPGYMLALECGSCGFQTLNLINEEIIKPATETEEGQLLKNYKCSYCKSVRTTQHDIAKTLKSLDEYRLPDDYVLKGQRQVKSLMIEIISNKGDQKQYYFQSTSQAADFLEKFDFDNVPDERS